MNSYYVTETTTYRFFADSDEEADGVIKRLHEDGVEVVDGLHFVGNHHLKIVDMSVDGEW